MNPKKLSELQRYYLPDEDSTLLLNCALNKLKRIEGKRISVLELACGTGFVTSALLKEHSKSLKLVICSDVEAEPLKAAKNDNLSREPKAELVVSDSAKAFNRRFDLVIFNPPYLPITEDDKKILPDETIFGGLKGYEKSLRFICSSLSVLKGNGKILFVTSSIISNSLLKTIKKICRRKGQNIAVKTVCSKNLFFEKLYVLEIKTERRN